MIHLLFLVFFFTANFNTHYISNVNQVFLAFGTLMFTYAIAIPVSVIFESPFLNLEKMLLGPKSQSSKYEKIRDTFKMKTNINVTHDQSTTEIENLVS